MALYRLHKKEWERSVWRQTEAYRSTSSINKPEDVLGKRGYDEKEVEDAKDAGGESKGKNKKKRGTGGSRQQFPGGGRKGISSGLDVIVRRNGKRVDENGRGDGSSHRKAGRGGMSTFTGGESWWELPAAWLDLSTGIWTRMYNCWYCCNEHRRYASGSVADP